MWEHSVCSGFMHSTEPSDFFGVAATVSAVSWIISPSLCLRAGRPAKQAHHLSSIHSSQPTDASPFWRYRGNRVWWTGNKSEGRLSRSLLCLQGASTTIAETWRGSQWGEWKRKTEPETIGIISHFFWYVGLMIHQKKTLRVPPWWMLQQTTLFCPDRTMSHVACRPLLPAGNKYLQQKWDKTLYELHRTKVKEIISPQFVSVM